MKLVIETGKMYNSRLERSRACFEAGKFLADPSNKYKEMNEKDADHYLRKAHEMFTEMELEWDLEEHRRFMESK